MDMVLCPKCGNESKYYDKVQRIVRKEYGKKCTITIERYFCENCNFLYRNLPEYLLPFKHYKKQIIYGFIFEELTFDMLEYEDYPCFSTVKKWKNGDFLI